MKDRYVVDTMAVVLRLEKRRISVHVKEVFVRAEAGHVELFIPAMVLALAICRKRSGLTHR